MDYSKLANEIADLSYRHYSNLPKTGKPKSDDSEWTLLSCIIQKSSNGFFKVVSLGTGSKCIGRSKLSRSGDVLNDCHAEVVARRGFLRYLYEKIKIFQTTGVSDILDINSGTSEKYSLQPNIEFYLFSSHVPCGDASIIAKESNEQDQVFTADNIGEAMLDKRFLKRKKSFSVEIPNEIIVKKKVPEKTNKFKMVSVNKTGDRATQRIEVSVSATNEVSALKKIAVCNHRMDDDYVCIQDQKINPISEVAGEKKCLTSKNKIKDIFRTGAKCVPVDTRQDTHMPGVKYHTIGAVRTKPGRGDPTLSVSCSDKLARWNTVGIQGALITHLIDFPILLSTIVIGGGGPFSKETMFRAVVDRFNSDDVFRPNILRASKVFTHSRYSKLSRSRPSPSSLIWSAVDSRPLEIAVDGRKQGATKKSKDSCLLASKKCLFETFISLTGEKFKSLTYLQCKQSAVEYQACWQRRKTQLGAWTEKSPDLQQFKSGHAS